MKVYIDVKNIELVTYASGYGLKGYYDENGEDARFSDRKRDSEAFAFDSESGLLDRLNKSKTVEDIDKSFNVKTPYHLEIKDNKLYVNWSTKNGLNGEFIRPINVVYGEIE